MPGPFPGVDPYIQAQGYWPDFHARFITYCSDALADQLPGRYEAVIGEQFRLYEDEESRVVVPDVSLIHHGKGGGGAEPRGAAVAAVLDPVEVPVALIETEEYRHTWIEVRRFPERALVAVIELLSPTNKYGVGRNDYLRKRQGYLRQDVHLIELDFLLGGPRVPMAAPLPGGDGLAIVARAGRRPMADVYAWSIRRALPPIPVPLRTPDPDVMLDLAAVYATAHERGRYARRLDYAAPLELPLADADRAWAEGLARTVRA